MSKNSATSVKFGLYKYTNSTNIGDEIQSIAARRFLPQVDYFIDRDKVGDWYLPKHKKKDDTTFTKLIANSWYMSEPFAWPIQNADIDPLFISMHIETEIPKVKEIFSSPESVEYLKQHQPIGCRDISTEKFFQKLGIQTYFSGCLTLTLRRDPYIKKEEFILAAGVNDATYEKIKEQTDRVVIRIDSHSENEDSFQTAEKYLYLYQSAHCVVTSRLHAMLPSLALETPVLFISDGAMTASLSRFDGLQELTHSLTESEYLSNPSRYDVNKPPKNPKEYRALRAKLIEKCYKFTGHNNSETFARDINFTNFNLQDCLDLILYNQDYLYSRKIQGKDEQITNLQYENQQLHASKLSVKKSFKQFAKSVQNYADRHFFHK